MNVLPTRPRTMVIWCRGIFNSFATLKNFKQKIEKKCIHVIESFMVKGMALGVGHFLTATSGG